MASTADQVALLFKKLLGAPNTLSTTAPFSEPPRSARAAVLQSQFYSEVIPAAAPADLLAVTTDDSGAALVGSLRGKTSSSSPMLRKYLKVALTVIPGTKEKAYECALDATFGRVLQDAVPYNYDAAGGSYLFTLYKSDGVTQIPFGSGDWVVDCEAGILTFYSLQNISGVSAAQPPKISFYRYIGAKGAATAAQTAAAIAGQAITFSKEIIFSGGSTTLTDDTLAAVQLDTRDLGQLAGTAPAMALQLGGDFNGSWRAVTYGGGGDATATTLEIQVRAGGAWVTKHTFAQI